MLFIGFDAFSFDPHKFATDYHLIGFRECATEVARYLAMHEGIDFQDPLRLRLMSHLHSYSSQRELSLKSCTGWNPSLFTTPMYPQPTATASQSASAVPSSTSSTNSNSLQMSNHNSSSVCETMHNSSSSSHHSSPYSASYSNYSQQSLLDNSMMSSSVISMSCNSNSLQAPPPPPPSSSKSPSAFAPLGYSPVVGSTTVPTSMSTPSASSSYTYPYGAGSYFGPTASYMPPMVPTSNNLSTANSNSQSSVKHYRPWGTELAY